MTARPTAARSAAHLSAPGEFVIPYHDLDPVNIVWHGRLARAPVRDSLR